METSDTKPKAAVWQLSMSEHRFLLFVGDLTAGIIALGIALIIWADTMQFIGFSREFLQQRIPSWFYFLPLIWMILLIELYDVHRAGDWGRTVRSILLAAFVGLLLYMVFYFLFADPPRNLLPRLGVAIFLGSVVILTLIWRYIYIRIFTAPQFLRRVFLVGAGRSGQLLLQNLNGLKSPPLNIVGIVDDNPDLMGQEIEDLPVIGNNSQLTELIGEYQISDIIVAISGEMRGDMFQALLDAQEFGVDITRMPVAYEEILGRVPIRILEANWIIRSFVDEMRVSGIYRILKRIIDILGGLVGLLILVLLTPFIAIAILLDDQGPVFYRQERSGRGGFPYKIIKFRTMHTDAEADGRPQWAKESDDRATRIGKFLRKTHLDELPQFINVLSGEMSLVGPRAERPELVKMFEKNVPFYRARLLVKPGITGWAQVNFGYASSIEDTITKLEYDLYYIKHRNIWLDSMILLRTPASVLGFRGR